MNTNTPYDFSCPIGDTLSIAGQVFSDGQGTIPQDITGATLWLVIKSALNLADTAALYKHSYTPSNAPLGLIAATVAKETTIGWAEGNYFYSVRLYYSDGTGQTVLSGTLTMVLDAQSSV